MTKDEKTKAIDIMAGLILALDSAHPDVGMGMWRTTAIDEALAKMGWSRTDIDYHVISGPKARR